MSQMVSSLSASFDSLIGLLDIFKGLSGPQLLERLPNVGIIGFILVIALLVAKLVKR